MKGECAMNARQCSSSTPMSFFNATSLGSPMSARSSSMPVTTSRNIQDLRARLGRHVECVERTREHTVIPDGGRQLHEAVDAQPRTQRIERRLVDAMAAEEQAHVTNDERLVRGESVHSRLTHSGDGIFAHAHLARLEHVIGPLELAVHLPRERDDSQL